MSGTKVWSTDHYLEYVAEGSSPNNMNQALFVTTYNFLQQHVTAGNATLHASFYGNGGATGFDYHDGANPAGGNAWAVFKFLASASTERTFDFYVMIQWADSGVFGTGGGSPGRINGGTADGCGICLAVRQDGGDPWGGSTAADGTDTKSATVWVPGGSIVSVVDRACGSPPGATSGSYVTNLENTLRYGDIAGTSAKARLHFYGDADALFFSGTVFDAGDYSNHFYVGLYKPPANLNVATPLVTMVSSATGSPGDAAIYGTATGVTSRAGGLLGRNPASGAGACELQINQDYVLQQPNPQYVLDGGVPLYDGFPKELRYGDGSEEGFVGLVDPAIISTVRGPVSGSTTAAFDTAYLGSPQGSATPKHAIPWDGSTAIGVGFTRAGNQTP